MGNRYLFAIDRVEQLAAIHMLVEMGDDLVSVEAEINPVTVAAAFRAPQQVAIKCARFGNVTYREGEVEGA